MSLKYFKRAECDVCNLVKDFDPDQMQHLNLPVVPEGWSTWVVRSGQHYEKVNVLCAKCTDGITKHIFVSA